MADRREIRDVQQNKDIKDLLGSAGQAEMSASGQQGMGSSGQAGMYGGNLSAGTSSQIPSGGLGSSLNKDEQFISSMPSQTLSNDPKLKDQKFNIGSSSQQGSQQHR
jgi:hypothetical protein